MNPTFLVGDRIKLLSMSDPYTNIQAGAQGVVSFIDDLGTLHVKWDNGHYLGLIPEIDSYERV